MQYASRGQTERQLLEKTEALARFTLYLKLLHRLSTTNYHQIDALFSDYLATGCEIFAVSYGAISELNDELLAVRALPPGAPPELVDYHSPAVLRLRRTITAPEVCHGDAACGHAIYIGAPILVNDQLYGTIGFWTNEPEKPAPFHPQAREIIELMAKSIGVAIHQRRLADQLAHQATHDALTGLPNRVLMKERIDAALRHAALTNAEAAVVFIDLDRFKQINDTLGHTIGDGLLQQIARRLSARVDPRDCLARMGGDEFSAVLSGFATTEDAVAQVRQFLEAVREPCRVEGIELFVTASIGISFFPRDGLDATTLLRNADSAMYTAKYLGKNDLHCYNPEGSAGARERLQLETDLRHALENNELRAMYQPQVTLDRKLAGLEVLLVWDHPALGRLGATQFISIAEETGLILSIGAWVLGSACRQAALWAASGHPVPIAVNVSALQFAQSGFVELIAETLRDTGLNPGALELELTESVIMRDVERSARRMASLRTLGVKIAIDDFGTGYSSLSYLRRIPADTLKIDRSFLRESTSGKDPLPLISTIVVLGHSLGLAVIAEGIETEKHLSVVKAAGCDRLQGHLFGGALDPEGVLKLLEIPVESK